MRKYDDDDPSNPFDRNGILKDGRTAHVTFRDAERTRDEDEDRRRGRRTVTAHDPMGRVVATYEHLDSATMRADPNRVYDSTGDLIAARPGFVATAHAEKIRRDAYEASCRELTDAWKLPAAGAYPLSAGEGSACTIDGAPDMLRKTADGRWLTSEPTRTDATPHDPRRPISVADAQAIRDAAYREMCDELTNAWRRT
jgi:hypothetical protein